MKEDAILPLARTTDLLIQEIGKQTLVYDQRDHNAHCLNELAALVWRHCDGQHTVADLATVVQNTLGIPNKPELVELALQDLAHANLLQGHTPVSPEQQQFTRRELTRKLSATAAAAFLLAPLVTSILTPPASAQTSSEETTEETTDNSLPSDRYLKEHFAAVDVQEILGQLVRLPITSWNYRSDSPAIRHIGPMAQDFATAFAVGVDDKRIHGADVGGVAFAAIQALYQKLQEQQAEIVALRATVHQLQQADAAR